jgi:putative membrane protein
MKGGFLMRKQTTIHNSLAFGNVCALGAVLLLAACSSEHPPTRTAADMPPPAEQPNEPSSESMTPANGTVDSAANPARSSDVNSVAPTTPSNQPSAQDVPNQTAPLKLSEGQVAMITELVNSAEIDQARLAQTKAKTPSVKRFANMMIKDHTEAKNEQSKMYKGLNLTPADSDRATGLRDGAEKTLAQLRAEDGIQFDMAYMDAQIAQHQQVLDALDHDLIPAAADQKMIDGLNKMRATVAAHLKQARTLQSELANRPAGTAPGTNGSPGNSNNTPGNNPNMPGTTTPGSTTPPTSKR